LKNKFFKLDSIRSRYIFGVVLLSVLFLLSVWASHASISSAVSDTAQHSVYRNNTLEAHRLIRESLRQANYQLQAYLVTPDKQEYEQVQLKVDNAIHVINVLLNDVSVKTNDQQNQLKLLSLKLIKFKKLTKDVMAVRTKAEELFPAYGVINNEMLPHNIQFATDIRLALEDMSLRFSEQKIQEVFHQCNQLKDTWNAMIGAFRIYMASRTITLGDPAEGNSDLESMIELHYQNLQKQLIELSSSQNDYDFGIQVENSLQNIGEISGLWHKAYLKIKSIYSSNNWRIDEKMMSQKIKPLNEEMWLLLHDLELELVHSYDQDTNNLAEIASNVNSALWVRMLIALGFIVIVFIAFELWVLEPIGMIARALKAEADGEEIKHLPKTNTFETRELVEAFGEMRSQIRMRQLELEHKAMHDVLTGLPNRLLLRRQLIQYIEKAKHSNGQLAMLMIDLNKFKEINDTLGHHMGDRVLREIGPRFISELAKDDVLARLGGDEFAVLLPDSDAERANDVAQRLSRSLDIDFNMDGQKLRVGSSIGIALYPQHGLNEHSLLQRADVAMYLAKHKGINHLVYDESQDEQSVWQLSFKGELDSAIKNNTLELHYQPRISLKNNTVTGFEALLRWQHPDQGLVPAEDIHLLAEKTGLIQSLTRWVVNTAVFQLSEWLKDGLDLNISVNLSVWNLQDQKLFECVKDALRQWNVPANKLILEIAESEIMSDPDSASQALDQLSQLGVQLSIDDFGIGFSSLQYLKRLPINELKIDKSFVMDLIVDENDAVIVRSTINLAHDLGLMVIAEGVESQEIYDVVQILGCDNAQGYHIAHAMPADQVNTWATTSNWGLKAATHLKLIR